jgi:DNA replication and repair protein RecF
MRIEKLQLTNFRNHRQTEIEFSSGINTVCGVNGSGKTSLLEAITICSISKSFLPVAESSVILWGEGFFSTSLIARNDIGLNYKISIKYTQGTKKQISSSYGDNLMAKDIIGLLPVVVLSPDFKTITFGAPQDRRQFIDSILCQTSKIYLDELIRFRKALKQRNNLLQQIKQGIAGSEILDTWTDLFIKSGSEIAFRRNNFIVDFIDYFKKIYANVSSGSEEVSMQYLPSGVPEAMLGSLPPKDHFVQVYKSNYNQLKASEIRRGTTLFGPQKDEFKICVNSGIARECASQGQHKSLLISLKFAEFDYIKTKMNETPVILLDDIFSELDRHRSDKTLELLNEHAAQTILTSTEPVSLQNELKNNSNSSLIYIENGIIMNYKL